MSKARRQRNSERPDTLRRHFTTTYHKTSGDIHVHILVYEKVLFHHVHIIIINRESDVGYRSKIYISGDVAMSKINMTLRSVLRSAVMIKASI